MLQEYSQSLKGKLADDAGLQVIGPGGEDCVTFEPAGVRITLPTDFPKGKPTGIATGLTVGGDFEITVRYAILTETVPPDSDPKAIRLTLMAGWEVAGHKCVKVTRSTQSPQGSKLIGYCSVAAATGKSEIKSVPTKAATGRLRIVRKNNVVFFYAAEEDDFELIHQANFGTDDLDNVRVVGIMNDAKASLDVRITDLSIRGDGIAKGPTAPGAAIAMWLDDGRNADLIQGRVRLDGVLVQDAARVAPQTALRQTGSRGWLIAALIIGTLITLGFGLSLGVWLFVRRGREPETNPAPSPGNSTAGRRFVSFPCADCGKTLKAKPALAGKWVKCTQCTKLVRVPDPDPEEEDIPVV